MAIIAEYRCMRLEPRNERAKGIRRVSSGFTLVEIISVICIMGIVGALSWPYLARTLAHYRLVTSAQEMAAAIRLVQQRAITDSTGSYYILFLIGIEAYRVYLPEVEKATYLTGVDIYTTNFPEHKLFFGATGEPRVIGARGTYPGGGTVTLRSSTGELYFVVVAPVTGRVRVGPEPPET